MAIIPLRRHNGEPTKLVRRAFPGFSDGEFNGDKVSVATIAGGVVGALFFITVALIICIVCRRKRRRRRMFAGSQQAGGRGGIVTTNPLATKVAPPARPAVNTAYPPPPQQRAQPLQQPQAYRAPMHPRQSSGGSYAPLVTHDVDSDPSFASYPRRTDGRVTGTAASARLSAGSTPSLARVVGNPFESSRDSVHGSSSLYPTYAPNTATATPSQASMPVTRTPSLATPSAVPSAAPSTVASTAPSRSTTMLSEVPSNPTQRQEAPANVPTPAAATPPVSDPPPSTRRFSIESMTPSEAPPQYEAIVTNVSSPSQQR